MHWQDGLEVYQLGRTWMGYMYDLLQTAGYMLHHNNTYSSMFFHALFSACTSHQENTTLHNILISAWRLLVKSLRHKYIISLLKCFIKFSIIWNIKKCVFIKILRYCLNQLHLNLIFKEDKRHTQHESNFETAYIIWQTFLKWKQDTEYFVFLSLDHNPQLSMVWKILVIIICIEAFYFLVGIFPVTQNIPQETEKAT